MDRLEVSFAANVRLMIKFPVIGQDQLTAGGWSIVVFWTVLPNEVCRQ